MKPFWFCLAVLTSSVLAIAPARAADDDVPSFKKYNEMEKEFVTKVGTAIVKAARTAPTKVELEKYSFEDVKKGRKDLRITMNWVGAVSRKKFTSTIVVKLDVQNKDRWEVLNIEYKDDSISLGNPREGKIQDLIKKFNR